MPYIDGLPVASVVAPTDLIAVDQGGTTGVPGSATTRQASVTTLFNISPLILSNLPTSDSGLATGTLWNNGGFLCIAP